MAEKTSAKRIGKGADAKPSKGFTAEEREAMKARVREVKAEARRARGDKGDGEGEVLAKIAELPEPDRTMANRLHDIVKASAPNLVPRLWYGMPAYAKDGNVVCFFQSAQKFKTRYATLGFSDKAQLDDGAMWPSAFALKELTAAEAARIAALVKKAVSLSTYLDTKRAGARPRTTPTNPHTQLDQNAPRALQEKVFALARSLAGVVVGPSHVSVPGARAFHLPSCASPADAGFMIGREFAHLHPPDDGSLHMSLPADIVRTVVDNGWAELHPLAGKHGLPGNIVMVYGPRDDVELEIVSALVRASHAGACRAS